ncbi:hypothetical protein T492DRAFT_893217 [Pavlovales sp. CCMP2436]|nr:hypothetical protein T492DRAFT_893217 [Pavlovales sp. CCMP2436]
MLRVQEVLNCVAPGTRVKFGRQSWRVHAANAPLQLLDEYGGWTYGEFLAAGASAAILHIELVAGATPLFSTPTTLKLYATHNNGGFEYGTEVFKEAGVDMPLVLVSGSPAEMKDVRELHSRSNPTASQLRNAAQLELAKNVPFSCATIASRDARPRPIAVVCTLDLCILPDGLTDEPDEANASYLAQVLLNACATAMEPRLAPPVKASPQFSDLILKSQERARRPHVEKKYARELCGQAFAWKHLAKPYACELCGKRYSALGVRNRHSRTCKGDQD